MKRIFLNHNPTEFFFDKECPKIDIMNWIKSVMYNSDNPFNLNEAYSTKVYYELSNLLWISGDEDSIKVTIEKIKPINI